MKRHVALVTLLLGGACFTAAEEQVSQADLLRRMVDLDWLFRAPPPGEITGMFSSYDRASRIDAGGQYVNWDANSDWGQFLRTGEDGWSVMAEVQGPGALTRMWSANPHGTIRFVLDGKTVVETAFENLFNGQQEPFTEPLCYMIRENGGKNCYFPVGFSESCKVELRDSRSYYQINFVQFPPGAHVQTFSPELDEAAQAALAEVKLALGEELGGDRALRGHDAPPEGGQWDIQEGEPLEWTLDGAGIIRALYVSFTDRAAPRDLYALHKCILRIYWDGAAAPAVEVPLVDFFGSGFDFRPYMGLPMGTDKWIPMGGQNAREDQFMYCLFPMPFSSGARIEIVNSSRKPIGVMLYLRVERSAPPEDSLRFKARFRKEDPTRQFEYPILKALGPGRVVGCLLNVDCPRATWWGEGDEKIWIDGERFPSYFGTGTEDYIGDAWGLREHARPFQGVTLRSNPTHYGKSSAYRWHISDCIDFRKSIQFSIENWQHGRRWDVYYSTIAYWYGPAGDEYFFKPLSDADLSPPGLRIPGSMEIEGRASGAGLGSVASEKYAGGVEYSGGEAVTVKDGAPLTVQIPSNFPRVVELKLRVNPRHSFDKITIDDESGRRIGEVTYDRGANGMYDVGRMRLNVSLNPVTVQATGTPVLDCWVLQDLPKTDSGFEAEDLKVAGGTGVSTAIEDFQLEWSGGSQRMLEFQKAGQEASFDLPARAVGPENAIVLTITRGPDAGRFQALLDGKPLGTPFDAWADKRELGTVALGSATLEQAHTLGFRALPNNPASSGMRLGLDKVEHLFLRSPFAVEAETLKITGSEGLDYEDQRLGAGYSAGQQVWCRANDTGGWIELEVPVFEPGRYRLAVVYTRSVDYGIVQTYVNGTKAGSPVDTFGKLQPGEVTPLGVFELPAKPLRLRVEVAGKNEASAGFYFGIDCIVVEPVEEE